MEYLQPYPLVLGSSLSGHRNIKTTGACLEDARTCVLEGALGSPWWRSQNGVGAQICPDGPRFAQVCPDGPRFAQTGPRGRIVPELRGVVRDSGGQNGVSAAPMRAVARSAQDGFPEGLVRQLWTVWAAHGTGQAAHQAREAAQPSKETGSPNRSLTEAWRAAHLLV